MIDLLPVELGSFDEVIGVYQLPSGRAEVDIRTSMTNEGTIMTHKAGYASTDHELLEGTKVVAERMCCFMAHVGDKGAEELKLKDTPVIGEYPEVFLEDLPE